VALNPRDPVRWQVNYWVVRGLIMAGFAGGHRLTTGLPSLSGWTVLHMAKETGEFCKPWHL
jgi:hypothetical protein